jgi:polyisoprenoid-binding protein YceI
MTTATIATAIPSATTTAPALRSYGIDAAHSDATFQVRHLLTKVRGRFSALAGQVQFDPAHPERSSVTFTVQVSSIDTGQPDRDAHLRSADFFHADAFPTLTFASRAVARRGEDAYDVTGDLTIRGITHEIVLPVTYLGQVQDPWGQEKIAFEAETRLNRTDYGLEWNMALETGGFLVGDEVRISLSIQAAAGLS